MNELLDGASRYREKVKRNRLERKFAALCNEYFGQGKGLEAVNTQTLQRHLPLLQHCSDRQTLSGTVIFSQKLVRQGFKERSFLTFLTAAVRSHDADCLWINGSVCCFDGSLATNFE